MSGYYFDGQGFVYSRAPPSALPSLNSSSLEAPSAVHHTFRMSSRRLLVILFVSRIEFLFISCCLLRGVLVVAGGGYYIVCVISHVSNLRLVHSLLLIIILLPPPCSLRTRLSFADSSYTWARCAGWGGRSFFARFLASSVSPGAATPPLLTSLTYYLSCGALGVYSWVSSLSCVYSCGVCAVCAAGYCAGSCRCLAQCCQGGDIFP